MSDPRGETAAIQSLSFLIEISNPEKELWETITKIPREFIKGQLREAKGFATKQVEKKLEQLKVNMGNGIDFEINRLKDLSTKNHVGTEKEILFLENKKREIGLLMDSANIRLDSLRFIFL